MTTVLINGELENHITVNDRGLQYGDGLFETIAVKNGQCCRWSAHMQRLYLGCQRLGIPQPDMDLLFSEVERLCVGVKQAIIKIIITRGEGGRGYRVPETVRPTRIVSIHAWPDYPEENYQRGVCLHLCTTLLSSQPVLAGIKHLNRLEQVMARNEWQDADIAEGLMSDASGHIIEGTMSNFFAVINNELCTPAIIDCGVTGIMRAAVIKTAIRIGIVVNEKTLRLDEIAAADELFICNSIISIWPVRKLVQQVFTAPGLITTKIMNGLR